MEPDKYTLPKIIDYDIKHPIDMHKRLARNKCNLRVYFEVYLDVFLEDFPYLFEELAKTA